MKTLIDEITEAANWEPYKYRLHEQDLMEVVTLDTDTLGRILDRYDTLRTTVKEYLEAVDKEEGQAILK